MNKYARPVSPGQIGARFNFVFVSSIYRASMFNGNGVWGVGRGSGGGGGWDGKYWPLEAVLCCLRRPPGVRGDCGHVIGSRDLDLEPPA